MTEAPTAFPLSWPRGRPRKPRHVQRRHKFTSGGKPISMAVARSRLQAELDRLGATYPLLSTNIELRLDGQPRSGRSAPHDPAACVYFSLKGKPFALGCDTFDTVEGNVAALAAHIEALRAIERHGVASAAESLEAFVALPPPPTATTPAARPWRDVLGLKPEWPGNLSPVAAQAVIQTRWRERATEAHPDTGGSVEKMAALNVARDEALKAVSR